MARLACWDCQSNSSHFKARNWHAEPSLVQDSITQHGYLCLKLYPNSHETAPPALLITQRKSRFLKEDEHTNLRMLRYAPRAAGDVSQRQHTCLHVQGPDSTPNTKDF